MNVLGLLDRAGTGRYRLDGEDVSALDVDRQARLRNRRIGFVFQAFHLLPRTSALENVELPLVYSDRDDISGLGRRALEAVGLADRIDHRPSSCPAGSSSASRSRAPSSTSRTCCWPTSRRGTSTRVGGRGAGDLRRPDAAGRTIVLVTHDPRRRALRAGRADRGRAHRRVEERPRPPRCEREPTRLVRSSLRRCAGTSCAARS